MILGTVRDLDAGTLGIDELLRIVRGADLSVLTDPWEKQRDLRALLEAGGLDDGNDS